MLFSLFFNHVARCGRVASDSGAYFFGGELLANFHVTMGSDVNLGVCRMIFMTPFVSRLSIVAAYIAIAFVGAIVLGVF